MKILVEGEKYNVTLLNRVFKSDRFYRQNGNLGTITTVGYYHATHIDEIVYMLPKVFMLDNAQTVFHISKDELLNIENHTSFKHKKEYNWIRQTSIFFYNSLLEYKKRNQL